MRMSTILGVAVLLAACSPGESEQTLETPATTASAPEPIATEEPAPTFWDNAPLDNGEHLKVHIDDRATAGDCDELDAEFEKWTEEDPVEGFTDQILAYIDDQRRAAGCL